jgi:hypothetical protein
MADADDSDYSLDLLNIFDIEEEGGTRHFVCFLEPVLAGAQGIPVQAIVGEFTPDEDGEFDPATFRLNEEFVAAFSAYMNDEVVHSPDLNFQAKGNPGGVLYLVDPRVTEPVAEPDAGDLLGGFAIDDAGQPVPESFRYNPQHIMFSPDRGPSGILTDRRFYNWLHPGVHGEDGEAKGEG